jgi:hypothetical protein
MTEAIALLNKRKPPNQEGEDTKKAEFRLEKKEDDQGQNAWDIDRKTPYLWRFL